MRQKILVYENALADKHPALDRALLLAKHGNVELRIVDVVDPVKDGLSELHRPMRSLVEQERKDRLYSICEPLHEQNVDFSIELIRGRPFAQIVREVVHEGIHLVIKTVVGRLPTAAMGMMGPVDMRLVRNCPCPVLLEAPRRTQGLKRIIVAIDPQTTNEELNNVLLDSASSLAKVAGGEVHVVSAWVVPDEDFLTEKMQAEKLAKYAEDLRASADRRLKALLAKAGARSGPNRVHFSKGDPVTAILGHVESYQPDILVMGTVCQTDVGGLLIGDTADMVLRQVNCSVLAIKPDSLFRV